MTLHNLLMVIAETSMMKLVIRKHGMQFKTESRSAMFFLDKDEVKELLEKRIIDLKVLLVGILEVTLDDEEE